MASRSHQFLPDIGAKTGGPVSVEQPESWSDWCAPKAAHARSAVVREADPSALPRALPPAAAAERADFC